MANDKKSEGAGKVAPKIETTTLKVLIHCEGCRKKVRKTLINIEGVHTVEVDGSVGKVTVTGTVDSKTLIKKLEKAGKVAELYPTGGNNNKGKDQNKGNNKENKEEGNGATEKTDNNGKGSNNNIAISESGKKKKGGGAMNPLDDSMSLANKSIAPNGIQTGYVFMDSAEYATRMFSDENANNCHIM